MSIKLFYHPFSRAATVVWMLEELGTEYSLEFVDLMKGAHKAPEFLAINPMGKLPTVVMDGVVLTEAAAIGMTLADRYGAGSLAPALDAPERATYNRWILYAPSVIEPCAYAHKEGWDYNARSAGWGTWEEMSETLTLAIGEGPWLLGDRFSMADVVFGGTVRFLSMFKMLDESPAIRAYIERLEARPAFQRSAAIQGRIIEERGLQVG